jgi:hypothetical protein
MIVSFSLSLASFPLFANQPNFELMVIISIWFEAFLLSLLVTICMVLKNSFKFLGLNKIYFKFIVFICLVSSLLSFFIAPYMSFYILLFSFILLFVMLGISALQYLQKKQPIGNLEDHKFWLFQDYYQWQLL